ncbi:exonuclease domain-containing protein [Rossellomorea vietnamensis]|uniref:exonuclease domain-containing protein n=1 Tax=Rossellomorea vietnamensis TaxID=218284 RepID=UPI003CF748E6
MKGFHVNGPDRLLENGAVKVKGYKVLKEGTFQTLVNPHRQISREIMELAGIFEESTKSSPSDSQAIQSFAITLPCLPGSYRVNTNEIPLPSNDRKPLIHELDWLLGPLENERYAQDFETRIYLRYRAVTEH